MVLKHVHITTSYLILASLFLFWGGGGVCFIIGQKSNSNILCSKCFCVIAGRMLINLIPNMTYLFQKTNAKHNFLYVGVLQEVG